MGSDDQWYGSLSDAGIGAGQCEPPARVRGPVGRDRAGCCLTRSAQMIKRFFRPFGDFPAPGVMTPVKRLPRTSTSP
jgi:hypothetical protein